MREFFFNPGDACPWYIREYMDRDTVHMSVGDLADPWNPIEEETQEDDLSKDKVDTDFIIFSLNPAFLRSAGYDPALVVGELKVFKEQLFSQIKRQSDLGTLVKGFPGFQKKVQSFLNRMAERLFYAVSLSEGKSALREILTLMGKDFELGVIDEDDLVLYNCSYTYWTKVQYVLGLFDPEELRKGNYYLKKVPEPNLWDIKSFLQTEANFIASAFFVSFKKCKENPSNEGWGLLYDEAESFLSLIKNLLIKVPDISVRNQKGEVWVLNTHDFFFQKLREKLISLAGEIPLGLREEFLDFHLPEEVQRKLSPRVVYRPWKKQ